MKKQKYIAAVLVLAIIASVTLSACGGGRQAEEARQRMEERRPSVQQSKRRAKNLTLQSSLQWKRRYSKV